MKRIKQTLIIVPILIPTILNAQSNLVSYWTFDDAKGTNLRDSSGGNTGTLTNGPQWTIGMVNIALSFDGTNDYVSIADSNDWDLAGKAATISAWVKASATQNEANARIIEHKTSTGGWHLALDGNNRLTFLHEANTNDALLTSSNPINDDTWHHVVVTLENKTAGVAKLYLDGALIGTDNYNGLSNANKTLRIAGNNGNNNFTGIIDDVRIFHSTASEIEATSLYTASVRTFYAHLDDTDKKPIPLSNPTAPPEIKAIDTLPYPRLMLTMIQNWGLTNAELAKYHVISAKGYNFDRSKQIQSINPDCLVLRQFSPRAYQDYVGKGGGSIPFERNGNASDWNGTMFSGHWLYEKGTRTTQSINANATTVTVQSASDIPNGDYVVIYDSGTNFANAEHCKVTGKSGNTLTITRGYKSVKKSHPSNSIIKPHVLGQGSNKQLWSYNHSTTCPEDANGVKLNEFMADWLSKNLNVDGQGNVVHGLRIDGVLFDADTFFMWKDADVNNDGVKDNGIINQENEWGIGLNHFYNLLRASPQLKDLLIVGGYHDTRGIEGLSGIQMETFPNGGNMEAKPSSVTAADYKFINTQMSKYIFNVHNNLSGPAYTENLNKTPTLLFPQTGVADSNAPNRVALTLTLMDNGFYGRKTLGGGHPDPWYDEFAVNIKNPRTASYGQAIQHTNRNNTNNIRNHMGWLGQPLGQYERIPCSCNEFAPSDTLSSNGHLNANLSGWTSTPSNLISRETRAAHVYEGNGSLYANVVYRSSPSNLVIKSPNVSYVNGEEYTVSFMAKAAEIREMRLGLAGQMLKEGVLLSKEWRRYIYSFTKKGTDSKRFHFEVGKEKPDVWIDDFYVFKGNANLYRRDFENGIAISNATPLKQSIDLKGNFMRINGTQDPINNGAIVSNQTITLDPFDGILLVRLQP